MKDIDLDLDGRNLVLIGTWSALKKGYSVEIASRKGGSQYTNLYVKDAQGLQDIKKAMELGVEYLSDCPF